MYAETKNAEVGIVNTVRNGILMELLVVLPLSEIYVVELIISIKTLIGYILRIMFKT